MTVEGTGTQSTALGSNCRKPLKEKPQARKREEQSSGVVIPQDAESVGTQPSTRVARHGDHNGHGTAPGARFEDG